MASFAEYTKKKRKLLPDKDFSSEGRKLLPDKGVSFTDYTKQVLGKDDIEAPTYKTYKVTEDNDIAPVKETKKTNERKWFEKGAFEDGYQFGDVTKTILGTGGDIGKNITTGIVGMGEKLLDAGLTLGAKMNQSTMNQAAENELIFNAVTGKKTESVLEKYQSYQDEVEKDTAKFVAKDLYDEEKVAQKIIEPSLNYQLRKMIGAEDEDKFSVLGEKADSLVQSAGQLAATAGLQAVGVPWWLTTGATTFGAEAESAFNEGATFDEAVLSSVISAGAEILTEKITGGISFGSKTFVPDELLGKFLGRTIANKTARTLIKLGADGLGEGFEEVLSGVLSALGQKLTYADDKDISAKELLFSEEALESFIGGFVLGGGNSGINAIRTAKSGTDYATGLTDNEKAVVDKIYEDHIAEAEEDGKKLTQKEKKEIYDSVLNDMEKGYISTDTIEEVLGGETYKTYKSTLDNEEALQKEFDSLNQMKQGEMTGEQLDRRAELKEQLADLKENSNKGNLKQQLYDEVFNLAKDSKLVESYNEKSRRGQAFEADLSQYDEKYQGTIKKAVESGILNNTRRTHEMVDFIAKISADKGVLFDFADNEKIKKSSYAVDGKTVNGFVDENGNVVLNINSAKSLNTTAGHEITHILERTELYDTLAQTITEYAKSKGDYQGRIEALNKLYKGVYKGEDFADKVNKELVADLVGDYVFTDKDFVRKLSTENRNIFEKIYDEIKYLCKVATAGSKEARELEKVKKAFADVYRESGNISKDTQTDTKYSLSADTEGKKLSKEQQDFFKDSKMRDDNGNLKVMYHGSEYAGFHEFNSRFSDDDTSFFFVDRNEVAQTYSGTSEVYTARSFNTVEEFNKFFKEIDAEEYEVVKQGDKYALLENNEVEITGDSLKELYDEFCDYTGLGQGQANYKVYLNLKNPLEVDANGRNWNRISGEFSQEIYDRYKSLTEEEKTALIQLASWEDSSIFRDELETAVESVERNAKYVDDYIRNLASAAEKLGDADMYRLFDIATDNFTEESLKDNAVKYLNTREYAERAKEQGYDGVIFKNIVDNGGFADGKEGASTVAIAFNSNQIKSVANAKPTANADIRYSVSDKNITDVSTGYAYDETYYTMSYKQDGKVVGTLEYGEYEGKPNVKMIEIIPEYRRKGIGTKLLQELQRKYPEQEIDFGMSTPDGTKLIDSITYDVTDEKVVADRQKLKALQSELNELQGKLDILYDTENLTEEQEAEMHRLGDRWEEVYQSINKLEPTLRGKRSKKTFVKYSLSEDSQGRELSAEQQNYFKDSKILDKNGNLQVMYHGTPESFTVFDKKKARSHGTYGNGFYFSDSNSHAGTYGETLSVYLNITNPLKNGTNDITKEQLRKFVEAIAEDEDYGIENYGYGATVDSVTDSVYGKTDFGMILDINISCVGNMVEAVELFNKVNGTDYNGIVAPTETVAFYPEQIKSIDNTLPTGNPDMRYSLSEADNTYLSAVEKGDTETVNRMVEEAAENSMPNSKVRDENGNLLTVYHGSPSKFTVFKHSKMNTHGNAHGRGFYFTEDKNMAEGYEKDGGQLLKGYLNIEKPLSEEKVTIKRPDLIKLIKATCEGEAQSLVEDGGYDSIREALPDTWVSNYVDTYNNTNINDVYREVANIIYSGNDNDVDIIAEITNGGAGTENTLLNTYKVLGYDGVIYTNDFGTHEFVSLVSNQFKSTEPITYDDNGNVIPLSQRFNPDNEDIRYSLSEQDEAPIKHGNFNIYGKDVKLKTAPTISKAETVDDIAPIMDNTPITEEEANAISRESLESLEDMDAPLETGEQYDEFADTTKLDDETVKNISKSLRDVLSLNRKESSIIEEIAQKYSTSEMPDKAELFWEIKERLGEKYYTETIEDVAEVRAFLRKYRVKVSDSIKSDISDYGKFKRSLFNKVTIANDGLEVDTAYQELSEMYPSFFPADIINPTDQFLRIAEVANMDKTETMSYELDDETIQEAVDIITDEVSAYKKTSARIEAEDMARESLEDIAPMRAEQIISKANSQDNAPRQPIDNTEYREAKKLQNLEKELADNQQLRSEAISDYSNRISRLADEYEALRDKNSRRANDIVRQITRLERLKANVDADYSKRISGLEARIDEAKQNVKTDRVANVLVDEPTVEKKKSGVWQKFKTNFLDKGSVFEDLSLKTKNRKLQAKYNFLHYSEGIAQRLIGKGTNGVKALNDIKAEVESTGKTKEFYDYLYHKHNVDRMSLENRYDDVENKPVFGDYVTSDVSKKTVKQYEAVNPEFKAFAEDVYTYMNYLRNQLVEKGVISQETADLWAEMYPNYVPIRRVGESGLNINVALDTNKTGINAPVKRATGGNSDILPLFDTMAMRTLQTFKATAKNNFGVELKNTLGTTIETAKTDIDGIIDSVDSHESLLQEGKNGQAPTFTVFENGERVTFEITEEMYDALKPTSKGLAYKNKVLSGMSNFHRALLTDKNPTFLLTNAVKDAQDVLLNSQHPVRTYANFPQAMKELLFNKGKYIAEYMENGGEQNTYFENQTNTFEKEKSTLRKIVGFPLDAIGYANNFIERIPRLAEYIASRKSGASVEVAMLDSARVTTNFAAGGDVTKFANRNGATFLNASVQGALQQVRNVREAKANGLKGAFGLIAKVTLAGLPATLLNHLLWDDDEEYKELSDYVKDNYYIVGKYGDGKFVRIPKGRASAVIQDAFEQIENALTGNDEVDFKNWWSLVWSNLAPNNPIDNNILAPVMQVANNKTWYGEELVPTRLQDLPNAEQFDESTDSISKWLGEKTGFISPYKFNYLLNQYSGGVGDVLLPMLTPEAESGDNSLSGNFIAPLKDKFTTDGTMNNQNVSDFYDTVDKLTKNAKSSKATDEDILMSKYMNSVNTELGELYGKKREIQNNSSLTDKEKYSQVKDIQAQINTLARESLNSYQNVSIEENYATVGNKHYRYTDGAWTKISDKQYERQQEVTEALGITPNEYWSKTDISFIPKNDSEYEYAYENPGKYAISKVVGDYDTYKSYSSDLYNIKADKDSNGKTISGSAKEKKIEYINNLDLDYGQRAILYRSFYSSKEDKNTYNRVIVDYLNEREDITFEEMKAILEELDFTVYDDGTIEW